MNNSARDDHEHEVDPTGVRALLSGLPDPGPMPDDVVARITARLHTEQQQRGPGSPLPAAAAAAGPAATAGSSPGRPQPGEGGAGPAGSPADAAVVDLGAERRRRRGMTTALLAGAAAVAVGTAVVASQFANDGVPGVVTADSGSEDQNDSPAAGDDNPGRGEVGQGDDGSAEDGAEPAPSPESPESVAPDAEAESPADETSDGAWAEEPDDSGDMGVQPGQPGATLLYGIVILDSDDVESQITEWFGDGDTDLDEFRTDTAGLGLEMVEAWSCLDSVDADSSVQEFFVAPASLDSRTAVLVVADRGESVASVWVLPGECVDGPVDPLLGPLELPVG